MNSDRWVLVGVVLGVALALAGVPYFAGAAHSLADTAVRLVTSGGHRLVRAAAKSGAPRRVVLGVTAVVSVLGPGVAAWLLVLAARGTLRLRAVVAVLVVALGAASFAYHPKGIATGTVLLALAVAAVAVAATGPFVAAPIAALAGLIGGSVVPALVVHARVAALAVDDLHVAVTGHAGHPFVLRVVLVIVALVPFALGLRSALRR